MMLSGGRMHRNKDLCETREIFFSLSKFVRVCLVQVLRLIWSPLVYQFALLKGG